MYVGLCTLWVAVGIRDFYLQNNWALSDWTAVLRLSVLAQISKARGSGSQRVKTLGSQKKRHSRVQKS